MIFLFLSVAAMCATALVGLKLHLDSQPKCSKADIEAIKVAHNNLVRVVTTLANKVGLSAKLHSAE